MESQAQYDKTLIHLSNVFDTMLKQSVEDPVTGEKLWFGKTTELLSEVGLSNGMYTRIFRPLMDMGCIVRVKRGGGSGSSVYSLVKEPDLNDYTLFKKKVYLSKSDTALVSMSKLADRVSVLEQSLKAIIEQQNVIYSSFQNLLSEQLQNALNGRQQEMDGEEEDGEL